jgi:hypothetical protein
MPSTYPRMKDRSYPHPPQSPQTPTTHTPTTPTTPSSRFLSPIQESRILSWRAHTTPLPESHERKEKGIKSAPATLDHDPSCAASGSSHNSREKGSSAGQSVSRCSCSSSPHQHHTQSGKPHKPHRTPTTAPPNNETTGKGHKHQHQMRSYYSSKKKSTTTCSTPTPQILSPPISMSRTMSMSSQSQIPQLPQQPQHGYDAPPMAYTQTAPQVPAPGTQIQPPPPRPDPPRIAGARDPISQN